MRTVADLHIHSKHSRATSENMDLANLAFYGRMKGLNLIGTGDALHPKWLTELSENLTDEERCGIYSLKEKKDDHPRFMVTVEVATVCEDGGKARKIHHLILLPSFDCAIQAADLLSKYGSLSSDGRPILSMSPPELVEIMMSVDRSVEVIPAHAWTPWWSIFGSVAGYDSVEECYKESSKHIHALETGLSSDPPMNWRISRLDRYALVSNSDCHSPYPHRLGREGNIFELEELSYSAVIDAVRTKNPAKFLLTFETKPEYGKYHWTGHRSCGVSMPPEESMRLDNRCPKCSRRMTVGVEQRIEVLADRPVNYRPPNVPGFVYLLPLQELIATAYSSSVSSRKVQEVYSSLTGAFPDEMTVLLDAPLGDVERIAGKDVAQILSSLRQNTLEVTPGYDGVYGVLKYDRGSESKPIADARRSGKKGLDAWMP